MPIGFTAYLIICLRSMPGRSQYDWGVGTISDRQFKKNIEPIRNALDTIENLHGVTFQWNKEKLKAFGFDRKRTIRKPHTKPIVVSEGPDVSSGTIRGFVAQDVEKVMPEWVKSDPRGFKWFAPEGIDAVLVEAIKDVDKENTKLKSQVAQQQKEIDSLAAQVAALEKAK
ncbi:MAG: tail fiber domain-containing protein [Elusimicrobiota bacterium]